MAEEMITATDIAVMKNDIGHMGREMGAVKVTLASINESLTKLIGIEARQLQLAETQAKTLERMERVEEQHRALDKRVPQELAERLTRLENEMPSLRQTRYWVYGAIAALVGGSFWGFVTGHLVVVTK